MKTSHTPGPWTFQGSMNGRVIQVGKDDGHIMQGGRDTIANVTMHGDESAFNQGEQTANARLIASAPELLACLEGIYAVAETVSEFYGNKLEVLNAARAAIAKAKGQP